jgi:hypothetical protein
VKAARYSCTAALDILCALAAAKGEVAGKDELTNRFLARSHRRGGQPPRPYLGAAQDAGR